MLWKIYFWVFSTLSILGLLIGPSGINSDLAGWPFLMAGLNTAISIAALWSFIYKKRILSKKYWLFIFLYVMGTIVIGIYFFPRFTQVDKLAVISYLFIALPYYFSLFRLAYDKNIFKEKNL